MPFIDLEAPPLDRVSARPEGASVTPLTPGKADVDHGSDTPDEAFTNAPQPEKPSAIGAMFRQSNTIASMAAQQDRDLDPHRDPEFIAGLWDEVKGTKYESHYPGMADVNNRPAFEARKRQIDMEEDDQKTTSALPLYLSLPMGLVAGGLDLPTLMPGGAFVRSARGTISIAKSALMTGAAAGVAVGGQEAMLHATQQTRTAEEGVRQMLNYVVHPPGGVR